MNLTSSQVFERSNNIHKAAEIIHIFCWRYLFVLCFDFFCMKIHIEFPTKTFCSPSIHLYTSKQQSRKHFLNRLTETTKRSLFSSHLSTCLTFWCYLTLYEAIFCSWLIKLFCELKDC